MKNPFKNLFKPRGVPDSYGGDHQYYNQQHSAPASQSLVPAGYPSGTGGGYGYNNYPPVPEPPTAYAYAPQQEAEKEEEAAWEFNAGNNMNKKGQQKAGHIKVGNATNGGPLPINLPKNGRFVFNAGANTNEGDMQEAGNIEFGNNNVRS